MFRLIIFSCLFWATFARSNIRAKPTQVKIVGGSDIDISKVPHQVSVQYENKHVCGGSIIGPKHILTAAHCVKHKDENRLSIRAGSNYDYEDGDEVEVAKIIYHPLYNADTYDYDAAVLLLASCVPLDEKAQIAELSKDEPRAGDEVLISGWGSIEEDGEGWNVLQSVKLPVVSREDCQKKYSSEKITDQMFCAGYPNGGKDSCKGDGGGPAMIKGQLAGIVSWGKGCAKGNYPGVYTNISKIRKWILAQV